MKYILALILMIPLIGCSAIRVSTESTRIEFPKEMFVCRAAPDKTGIVTDQDLGVFIANQDATIRDCRGKLQNVGDYVQSQFGKVKK